MKDRLWSSGLVVLGLLLLAWFYLSGQSLSGFVDSMGKFLSRLFGY